MGEVKGLVALALVLIALGTALMLADSLEAPRLPEAGRTLPR